MPAIRPAIWLSIGLLSLAFWGAVYLLAGWLGVAVVFLGSLLYMAVEIRQAPIVEEPL